MKERPILLSSPMVRALLAGKKTQTRRAVKPAVVEKLGLGMVWIAARTFPNIPAGDPVIPMGVCPYGEPGDRLWVKERWRTVEQCDTGQDGVVYSDNETFIPIADTEASADDWVDAHSKQVDDRWRSPLFMPRWASRITLEVTEVRVQRLQDISEDEILAEGCSVDVVAAMTGIPWSSMPTLHDAWREAWSAINGDASWDTNPWVWAISFKRVPAP